MNKLSSVLGAIAVIAIAVVFIVQFRPASNAQTSGSGPRCAVEVHGSCISKATFDAAQRLIATNADAAQLRAMGFRKKVANGLIEAWVLNEDARRLGITISDEEVTAEIAKGRAHVSVSIADMESLGHNFGLGPDLIRIIPVKSPKTKKFDAKYAEKMIRQLSGMSPAEFREYQRSEIIAARMREIIRSRVRISDNEAFDRFSRERSTVTLDYVRFDRRFFADLLVDLSPKAVDAWADGHKEEIDKGWDSQKAQILPECRSVREIFVKLDEAPTDDEKAKARARIDRARERVLKGEDFADVARAVSESVTAPRGGEITCLAKGQLKPLEDAVATLAAGKVSEVIPTDKGFYVAKLEHVAKDAEAEKLGRAQMAKGLYLAHEAERLTVEAAKKVAAAVKGGKSMKEALDVYLAEIAQASDAQAASHRTGSGSDRASGSERADDKKDKKDKKKGDDKKAEENKADDRPALSIQNHPNRPTLETTMPFNALRDPIPGVRQSAELARTAFALEKPGDAPADAIPFDTGYLAIQLKEKTPASKEDWEKSKETYLGPLRATKASYALLGYLKRLQGQLAADAKPDPQIVNDAVPKGGESAPMPIDDDPGE